jgi:hypothetical protein
MLCAMAALVRLAIAAVTAIGTYGLTSILSGAVLTTRGIPVIVPFLMSLAAAFFATRFVWRRTADTSGGLLEAAGVGALVTGGVGFVGGFFGPMILDPGANQGPLLGILITGPLGFVLGGVGGAVYWAMTRARQA